MIRTVTEDDAAAITDIYNYYVSETTVSFETTPLSVSEMLQRIRTIAVSFPYFVAEEEGRVVGYSYAHLWKEREAYCHTWEVTIYLAHDCKGRGIGSRLMRQLVDACCAREDCGQLIACITAENAASIAFHSRMGFEKVSHFKRVGFKFDRWLDVVDMELRINPPQPSQREGERIKNEESENSENSECSDNYEL